MPVTRPGTTRYRDLPDQDRQRRFRQGGCLRSAARRVDRRPHQLCHLQPDRAGSERRWHSYHRAGRNRRQVRSAWQRFADRIGLAERRGCLPRSRCERQRHDRRGVGALRGRAARALPSSQASAATAMVWSMRSTRFGELLVWQDANQNHSTDAGELRSLAEQRHRESQGRLRGEAPLWMTTPMCISSIRAPRSPTAAASTWSTMVFQRRAERCRSSREQSRDTRKPHRLRPQPRCAAGGRQQRRHGPGTTVGCGKCERCGLLRNRSHEAYGRPLRPGGLRLTTMRHGPKDPCLMVLPDDLNPTRKKMKVSKLRASAWRWLPPSRCLPAARTRHIADRRTPASVSVPGWSISK